MHAEARRYADTGHLVALVGHADHVEVIGTKGERPDAIVVVESPEDAERLDVDGKPLAVISQTTLSLDDVASTVAVLERRFGGLRRPAADDICYATQNRQDAVKRLAEEATLILVIGSETSSNAKRLVEVASLHGAEAALIDGESELDSGLDRHSTIGLTAGASTPEELVQAVVSRLAEAGYTELDEELLDGHATIGLTAGASTPEELVQAVLAQLAARGYDEVEQVTVAREDVQFRLPREVATS